MEITNLPLFKRSMKFLGRVFSEIKLKFNGQDMMIVEMDYGRYILIKYVLKNILHSPVNKEFNFPDISLDDFNQILEQIDNDKLIIEKDGDFLVMTANREMFTLKFEEHDSDKYPFENLAKIEHDMKKSFDLEELKKIIKKGLIYSEEMRMTYDSNSNRMQFTTEGSKGKYVRFDGITEKTGETTYNLNFLRFLLPDISDILPGPITLHIKTDHPLKVEYKDSLIEFKQWLSPKIYENDDLDDDKDDGGEF